MAKRKAPFDPAKAAATTRRVSLPPDPDETNDERALYAMKAARAFAKETGQTVEGDGLEEILSDLLANIGHLCDRHGLEFEHLLFRAEGHYDPETDNKGLQIFSSHN